jgi:histidine ammonia-lyase
MTMAPLGARRLREMVELGERIATIELVVAAQAVDLRGGGLGQGTLRAREIVREGIAFSGRGDPVPPDLGAVRDAIRSGRFAALTR